MKSGDVDAYAASLAAQHEGDFVLDGVGDSMAPYFRTGTAVVVHPAGYFMLRAGMPVVYTNHEGRQVAHVLVERSADGWIVQGVNNAEPDDDRVTPANLVGVVRGAFAAVAPATGKGAGGSSLAALTGGGGDPIALLH